MAWLSNKILCFMLKNNVILNDEEVLDFYRYGIEIMISSTMNILLVLLFGIITGGLCNAIFYLLVFILIRQFSGGYHANTYFKCIFLTNLGFLSVNLICKLIANSLNALISIICLLPSILIIVALAPIENANKPIPIERRKTFKIISCVLCLVTGTISIILTNNRIELGTVLLLTLIYIAILSAITVFKERE